MEKMSKMDRAKQFMPFAALRGYEDEIRRKEFLPADRRDLTEEELNALNDNVKTLKKGDVAEAEYYCKDRYVQIDGAITEIDFTLRKIRIIKTVIPFDDLTFVRKIK